MWTDPSLSSNNIHHFCCCLKMCLFAEHYRGAIGPEGFVQFRVNEIELAALPLRLLCHCQPRLNNKQVASNSFFFLKLWKVFALRQFRNVILNSLWPWCQNTFSRYLIKLSWQNKFQNLEIHLKMLQ